MILKDYIDHVCHETDMALDRFLPQESTSPTTIHKAMRYSIFAGGKRLRPVLCVAAAEACGGNLEKALPPACAVEMIHVYSLIHDDLPALDNDDLRRGKATNHKIFGEGIAVLAGDALLTEAFTVISQTSPTIRYSVANFMSELAQAGSSRKLIGGQVLDLEGEQQKLSHDQLIAIHEGKTAALIIASLRFGAMSANATPEQLKALTDFGYNLGLAFQVIDDILDITADTATLGKTAGKDLAAQKSTYPSVLGLEQAKAEAARLTENALSALKVFAPEDKKRLIELSQYLLNRHY